MSRAKPRKRKASEVHACRGCINRMAVEGRCLTYGRDFYATISKTDHRKIRVVVVREVLPKARKR